MSYESATQALAKRLEKLLVRLSRNRLLTPKQIRVVYAKFRRKIYASSTAHHHAYRYVFYYNSACCKADMVGMANSVSLIVSGSNHPLVYETRDDLFPRLVSFWDAANDLDGDELLVGLIFTLSGKTNGAKLAKRQSGGDIRRRSSNDAANDFCIEKWHPRCESWDGYSGKFQSA